MNYYDEYKRKLRTPEEAVKVIKDGDWIDYTVGQGQPVLLDKALAKRKGEVQDVNIRGYFMMKPLEVVEADPNHESFCYHSWYCAGFERKYWQKGLISFIPMIFRNHSSYYNNGYAKVNVAMMSVAPMDKHGYFNLSILTASAKAVLDAADTVILEVDENLPRVHGHDCNIHISDVDIIVEGKHEPLVQVPSQTPSEEDIKIAGFIANEISDGACIQLGIGGMPNTLGEILADSDLKDLGCHTELLTDAYLKMYEKGKLTNMKKSLHKGKTIYGLCAGSKDLYDWVDENPQCFAYPVSYVNDPYIIAQNDNMVAVNNCVSVDLYGQVCAESSGTRHISGTGGQLDFLTGAYNSKGGKSFICMTSSYTDKKGNLHSRIKPTFSEGDIISDPRSQAFYFVTEYGIINLAAKSTWQRAELLISLAHPDFRDELIAEAEKQHIWRRSNKR